MTCPLHALRQIVAAEKKGIKSADGAWFSRSGTAGTGSSSQTGFQKLVS
jgi:hypothetical protein